MILCIGDIHFKSALSYADYCSDHRINEEKEVLDFIVKQSSNCEKIVFIGDIFNSRTNPPEIIKKAVEFIERFNNKEIFILGGNHEKISEGKSALDFLREIKGHHWHLITERLTSVNDYDFLPYLIKPELGTKDFTQGVDNLLKTMDGGKILFTHFAISGTYTSSGAMTNLFNEVVLPEKELTKRYKLIVGGHIHQPLHRENLIVTGSIFTNEVGETDKYVWKIDEETLKVERIMLPGRGIYKVENPTAETLEKAYPENSIIKVILTEKKWDIEELKEKLKKYDAYLIVENYPSERKQVVHSDEDVLNMDIKDLLALYAKAKNVPEEKLKRAWEIVKA